VDEVEELTTELFDESVEVSDEGVAEVELKSVVE
jgi:hypothetical protein